MTAFVAWFGRHTIFSVLDRQQWAATHPTYSPPLHIGESGHWEWAWPRGGQPNAGEVQIKLVLRRRPSVPFEHYEREKTPLRLRVSAYQVSPSGRKQVIDTRFPVDRPDVGSSYAVSGYAGDEVEHTIGSVYLDAARQTILTVDVETPDAVLQRAEPRLMVVGAYDYAALGLGGILLLARDVVAGGIAVLLLASGLAIVWRGTRQPSARTTSPAARL